MLTPQPYLPLAERSRSFVGVYLASFVTLLCFALVAQILWLPWRRWLGAEGDASLVASVQSVVYSFLSYIP